MQCSWWVMEVVKNDSSVEPHPVPAVNGVSNPPRTKSRHPKCLPGMSVFHLARVSFEKKSGAFVGVKDMSDSNLTTRVRTANPVSSEP